MLISATSDELRLCCLYSLNLLRQELDFKLGRSRFAGTGC